MCSMNSVLLLPIWSSLPYSLQLLAGLIGLAAGIRIIFAAVEHAIVTKINKKEKGVSQGLWRQSRLWAVISQIPAVRRFVHRRVPVVGAFVLGCLITQLYQDAQWPTYQYKWVTVRSQTDVDTFHLVLPQGIEFVAKFCEPVPPLVPGVIMEVFTYQERPDCMFVGKHELIKYHRDSADNVVDAAGHELYAKEK